LRGRITRDGEESRKDGWQHCGNFSANSPQALSFVNELRRGQLHPLILRSLRSKRLEGCGHDGASWFETREDALLTMRVW
jgi:hypothetical protein